MKERVNFGMLPKEVLTTNGLIFRRPCYNTSICCHITTECHDRTFLPGMGLNICVPIDLIL